MQNKKILHIVSTVFSLDYFIGNQFLYFKNKADFTVASPNQKGIDKAREYYQFKYFDVNITRTINPWSDIKAIIKLYKFIKKEKFDIVVAHSPKGGLIGMIASFSAKIPRRVFFRHGLVFETATGVKKKILILIEKITGRLATNVVNVSESLMDESNIYKLNSSQKNIIIGRGTCNGVDVEKFRYRKKTNPNFVVGFVGRLAKDKGIKELVEAWEIFSLNKENVQLLLIGPIDDRNGISQEILSNIKSNPKIQWKGYVAETSYYYNEMDVFILPSYREGFPTVILEASASEIPIITTKKTGCVNAIVENQTGIFTDISPQEIANSIEFYYHNENARKQHGNNARIFIENYFREDIFYGYINDFYFS